MTYYDRLQIISPGAVREVPNACATPAMRDLFMDPSNKFRLQEALISILAGDIYRQTPVRARLLLFQAIYYVKSLFMLRKSLLAWLKRKRAIQAA